MIIEWASSSNRVGGQDFHTFDWNFDEEVCLGCFSLLEDFCRSRWS